MAPRQLLLGGVVASIAMVFLPPAGSIDILNYAVYGRISDLGLDPYSMTPQRLHDAGDPVGLLRPSSWADQPTVYGPVATVEQALAAWLGGASMGWIIFWLKAFNATVFIVTGLLLDRLAGPDPAARIRAAILWTANPLMLFWMVGSGHADTLASVLLIGAGCVLWHETRRPTPVLWFGAVAGLMAAGAVLVKVTFALPVLGLALACLRRPRTLAAGAATTLLTVVITYAAVGRSALTSLTNRMSHDGDLFLPVPSALVARPMLYTAAMGAATLGAAALIWRALPPPRPAATLDLRPAVACGIAAVILSPVQYPWYCAAFFPVLALLGATYVDEALAIRSALLSCIMLPGIGTSAAQFESARVAAPLCTAVVMLATVVQLVRTKPRPHSRIRPGGSPEATRSSESRS
ncbi:polyprenol phosphomannose-dependent alpha 1,6 mannosyltransferase MptB [Actinomadura spongiicola]|uniref:polyprenol phosphomannose-dependent alpha 1,6 mannosyltransferase MptB n=1 Tax=Actinomadura spongiicola TaxID=2303421 RepID=UPI001314568A|nr:polyprenol phosphomannose-dependent alpha 1,6 mannosyltransferase MptB [Actinomadura spongiicola]